MKFYINTIILIIEGYFNNPYYHENNQDKITISEQT